MPSDDEIRDSITLARTAHRARTGVRDASARPARSAPMIDCCCKFCGSFLFNIENEWSLLGPRHVYHARGRHATKTITELLVKGERATPDAKDPEELNKCEMVHCLCNDCNRKIGLHVKKSPGDKYNDLVVILKIALRPRTVGGPLVELNVVTEASDITGPRGSTKDGAPSRPPPLVIPNPPGVGREAALALPAAGASPKDERLAANRCISCVRRNWYCSRNLPKCRVCEDFNRPCTYPSEPRTPKVAAGPNSDLVSASAEAGDEGVAYKRRATAACDRCRSRNLASKCDRLLPKCSECSTQKWLGCTYPANKVNAIDQLDPKASFGPRSNLPLFDDSSDAAPSDRFETDNMGDLFGDEDDDEDDLIPTIVPRSHHSAESEQPMSRTVLGVQDTDVQMQEASSEGTDEESWEGRTVEEGSEHGTDSEPKPDSEVIEARSDSRPISGPAKAVDSAEATSAQSGRLSLLELEKMVLQQQQVIAEQQQTIAELLNAYQEHRQQAEQKFEQLTTLVTDFDEMRDDHAGLKRAFSVVWKQDAAEVIASGGASRLANRDMSTKKPATARRGGHSHGNSMGRTVSGPSHGKRSFEEYVAPDPSDQESSTRISDRRPSNAGAMLERVASPVAYQVDSTLYEATPEPEHPRAPSRGSATVVGTSHDAAATGGLDGSGSLGDTGPLPPEHGTSHQDAPAKGTPNLPAADSPRSISSPEDDADEDLVTQEYLREHVNDEASSDEDYVDQDNSNVNADYGAPGTQSVASSVERLLSPALPIRQSPKSTRGRTGRPRGRPRGSTKHLYTSGDGFVRSSQDVFVPSTPSGHPSKNRTPVRRGISGTARPVPPELSHSAFSSSQAAGLINDPTPKRAKIHSSPGGGDGSPKSGEPRGDMPDKHRRRDSQGFLLKGDGTRDGRGIRGKLLGKDAFRKSDGVRVTANTLMNRMNNVSNNGASNNPRFGSPLAQSANIWPTAVRQPPLAPIMTSVAYQNPHAGAATSAPATMNTFVHHLPPPPPSLPPRPSPQPPPPPPLQANFAPYPSTFTPVNAKPPSFASPANPLASSPAYAPSNPPVQTAANAAQSNAADGQMPGTPLGNKIYKIKAQEERKRADKAMEQGSGKEYSARHQQMMAMMFREP